MIWICPDCTCPGADAMKLAALGYTEPHDPAARCAECGVGLSAAVRTALLLERLSSAAPPAPAPPEPSEWLDAEGAGALLGMTPAAIYADVQRGGRLAAAASRVGRRLRFSRKGLEKLLRNGHTKA